MKVLAIITGFLLAAAFLILIAVGVSIYQHQKDLEENGCQVQVRAKTGKRVLVGKISHDEEVVVYECANGRRVEFQ